MYNVEAKYIVPYRVRNILPNVFSTGRLRMTIAITLQVDPQINVL